MCIPHIIATQRRCEHVPAATNTRNKDELLDVSFSMLSMSSQTRVWESVFVSPVSLHGNGSVNTFLRQRRIVGGVVFCAFRVVSNESMLLVLPITSCYFMQNWNISSNKRITQRMTYRLIGELVSSSSLCWWQEQRQQTAFETAKFHSLMWMIIWKGITAERNIIKCLLPPLTHWYAAYEGHFKLTISYFEFKWRSKRYHTSHIWLEGLTLLQNSSLSFTNIRQRIWHLPNANNHNELSDGEVMLQHVRSRQCLLFRRASEVKL
jgi:hypothetical protein